MINFFQINQISYFSNGIIDYYHYPALVTWNNSHTQLLLESIQSPIKKEMGVYSLLRFMESTDNQHGQQVQLIQLLLYSINIAATGKWDTCVQPSDNENTQRSNNYLGTLV